MAYLSIGVQEAVNIIKNNTELPENITAIEAEEDIIYIEVKIGSFIPDVRFGLQFYSFIQDEMTFDIVSKVPVVLIRQIIQTARSSMNTDIFEMRNNKFVLQINKFLSERIKGVKIKDCVMEKACFYIIL